MRDRKFFESVNAAVEGFVHVMKSERNMRIHFLMAIFFITLGVYLNFTSIEILMLCVTIMLVLISEMLNTAIELIVDMIKSEFHPVARIIKDVGAGAVLLASVNAIVVGYMLFSKRVPFNIATAMWRVKQSPWHITFISLVLVAGISIMAKILFHKGTPLRGGMPSGHAAIAFSIWTAIVFLTNNTIVIILSLIMAFLITRQRVRAGIHNIWEALAGSLLGVLITTLIFQLLR